MFRWLFGPSPAVARKPVRFRPQLEALEDRLAPAAVVTFFEADGDKVTVKTSKGTTAQLEDALDITTGATLITGFTVDLIESPALATAFAETNISISAKGGAGPTAKLVNDVTINAFNGGGANNIDLGKVTVKGFLHKIDAGDNVLITPAIAKVNVINWGLSDGFDALRSQIRGNITSITVKNNFDGWIESSNAAGDANFQDADGTVVGSFKVGNIAQATGDEVGYVQVHRISTLTVKGTFSGSNGSTGNGLIEADSIGKMDINEMTADARIVLS